MKQLPNQRKAVWLCLMLVMGWATGSALGKTSFDLDEKAGTLDIVRDGKPVLRYMFARDDSTPERRHETYKVYCHVFDPAGKQVITKGPGGKYTHHRGIFLGWNKLRADGKSYDLWHMHKNCTQTHREILAQRVEDDRAVLSVQIDWLTGEGKVLIKEVRTFVMHTDAKAHLSLDVTSQLTAAGADLQLGGDPEHAGFQYRPHNDVAGNKSAKYLFPRDSVDLKKDVDLPWAVLTYTLGDATYTVQHMNHPDNPQGAKYSAYRDYGRFGAFPSFAIKAGQTATLKYGIRVTTGPAGAREQYNRAHQAFVQRTARRASQRSSRASTSRPNILFCIADDWGWPHAGAYGDPVVKTPTFDELAKRGVLFDHAYVSSPSCTPCRNALLTGQYHWRLERGANLYGTLDIKFPVYPLLLEKAGYHVGHWRKSYGPGRLQEGGYKDGVHPAGKSYRGGFKQFLDARPKGKPFCFWLGSSDPHRPYKQFSGKQSGMDIDRVPVPGFWPNVEEIRSDIADYYFEVQRFDTDCGNAVALLEEIGELENTIIVMTGDHGMPFPRCKSNLYDMGVRVPVAIRWDAKVKPGRRIKDFISFVDFAPTFLEAAGVEASMGMTGRSLLPLLCGDKQGWIDPQRDHVIFGKERHVPAQKFPSLAGYPCRGIRTKRYLYIRNFAPDRWPAGAYEGHGHTIAHHPDCDDGPTKQFLIDHRDDPKYRHFYELSFAQRPAEELYDLDKDPDQLVNIAEDPDYAEVKKKLATQLMDELKATGDPRLIGGGEKFDAYPYGGRMKMRANP